MHVRHPSLLSLALGCLGILLAWGRSSLAVEPAEAFLAGLRERGYYEMAMEYLDKIATSKLVPAQVKESIPFERGMTLIESSRLQRDPTAREKQLDEAQAALASFIAKSASHPRAPDARSQLGNVIIERARVKVTRAMRPNAPAAEKTQLLADARKLFDDARQAFEAIKGEIRKQLEQLGNKPNEEIGAEKADLRDLLRGKYIEAQLVSAQVQYEKAATIKENKAEYEKLLKEAAKEFGDVYVKYRTRLAGLYARMLQGRCFQDLGTPQGYKDALSYYGELLEQPNDPEPFRILKTKALKLAMECWLADKKQGEVITRGETWLNTARPTPRDLLEEDWIEIRMSLAKAYKLEIDALKAGDPKKTAHRTSATRILRQLAQIKGAHQADATRLLAELGGGGPTAAEDDKPRTAPKTFAEARDAGKAALDEQQTLKNTMEILKSRLATAKDAATKKQLQDQITENEKAIPALLKDAVFYFEAAVRLADRDIPDADLNVAQYYLCYCYYTTGDYYNAAVLGTFMASRYPNSTGGRPCAEIALASYQQLHFRAPKDARSFETAQLTKLCQIITQKWPTEPQAVKAFTVMIQLLVAEGKLEEARANLQNIPPDSEQRGSAELLTGQAMWRSFLLQSAELRKARGDGENPATLTPEQIKAKEEELEKLKVAAKAVLNDGISRMQKLDLSDRRAASMPSAMLYLSQIYVDSGESVQAIAVLEDPKFGPLTLLDKKDPSLADKPSFAGEAYKAALRAYIASLPKAQDAKATLAKADAIMNKLMASYGKTPEDKKRLVNIFVNLAQELKDLIDLAQPSERGPLMDGFEKFLTQVSAASTELSVRNWVAETFKNMAEAAATPGAKGKLTPQQIRYFDAACAMYAKILVEQEADLDPDMAIQLRLQLARSYRQMGKYPESVTEYAKILEVKPMALNVQIEAAETYQLRGRSGDPNAFLLAMRGGRARDVTDPATGQTKKENVVWGWAKLGKVTQKYDKFQDVFFQAWYHQAESAFEYALANAANAELKKKYVTIARDNILGMAKGWPTLGGPEMWKQYDTLYRKVQTQLGEKVTGLTPPAAPAPATAAPPPATTSATP